jgi:hypothetical protein
MHHEDHGVTIGAMFECPGLYCDCCCCCSGRCGDNDGNDDHAAVTVAANDVDRNARFEDDVS